MDKKTITKRLLREEFLMIEAVPVSFETSNDNVMIDSYNASFLKSDSGEATLTLRIYDRDSIESVNQMMNSGILTKIAMIGISNEV